MSERVTDCMERAVSLRVRLEVGLHLLRCSACRRYFDQVRQTVMLGVGQVRPPDQTTEETVFATARRPGPHNG